MQGYVAVTDPGWHAHLARTPDPKDANFWKPSARAFRLDVGTPFFFKIKAPHNAIAGFGYFAGFSVLPDWMAWETFGESNGVGSLAELRARLRRVQDGARIEPDPTGRIGCCLIAESCFFPPSDWVPPPASWSPRTQTGARLDLESAEGQRVWNECVVRSAPIRGVSNIAAPEDRLAARYGTPTLHLPRLGQGIFRVKVLDAYERACAVTGEHSLPVLEAAHIRPYSEGGQHAVTNGLVLRSDIHRLFDTGYVTVSERGLFVVGRRLNDEFENGASYYKLQGQPVAIPKHGDHTPDRLALEWHRSTRFRG